MSGSWRNLTPLIPRRRHFRDSAVGGLGNLVRLQACAISRNGVLCSEPFHAVVTSHPKRSRFMTKSVKAVIVLASALTLAGCANPPGTGPGPGEAIGTVGGAVGGALLGNMVGGGAGRVRAPIAGGLLGGFLGNQVGSALAQNAQQQ